MAPTISNSDDIILKPAGLFAIIKISPFILGTVLTTWLAYQYQALFIILSIFLLLFALYRYIYVRRAIYLVTTEYIRIRTGILFKRSKTVELFRVKDYIITQPPLLQILTLMDLQLKTTDPENPILWLRGIPQTNIIDTLRNRILQCRNTIISWRSINS
ncbi:PH domain-containing protein [Mucilaginibacter phyllosphaerae]